MRDMAAKGALSNVAEDGPQVAMFIGALSKLPKALARLKKGKGALGKGASAEDIWRETQSLIGPDNKWRVEIDDRAFDMKPRGWEDWRPRLDPEPNELAVKSFEILGPDNKWRVVIDDRAFDMKPGGWEDWRPRLDPEPNKLAVKSRSVGGAFAHPELFEAYPNLARTAINADQLVDPGLPGVEFGMDHGYFPDYHGYNEGKWKEGHDVISTAVGAPTFGAAKAATLNEVLMQLQNSVQAREGFTPPMSYDPSAKILATLNEVADALYPTEMPGNVVLHPVAKRENIDAKNKRYAALADMEAKEPEFEMTYGAAEAQAVAARRLWTDEQRAATPPWVTMGELGFKEFATPVRRGNVVRLSKVNK